MKDSWQEITIGEEVTLLGGYSFSSSQFNEDGIGMPLIRIRDLLNSTQGTYYNGLYLPMYLVENGDILIGMDGDFHVVKWKNTTSLLNQRILKVVPKKKSKIDINYFFYFLSPFLSEIHAKTSATTVKHLSTYDISRAVRRFPPLVQQQKIAKILTTCDEVIEKTEAVIAKYQAIKQGMMQDLFTRGIDVKTGKLRSKFEDAPQLYKTSDLGAIPKDWEVKHLDDCINPTTVITYGIVQTGEHVESGIRVLRTIDLNEDGIDSRALLRTTKEIADSYRRTYVIENDIVCNVRASVGDFNIITEELTDCNLTRGVARISLNKAINPRFMLGFLRSETNSRQMRLLIKGTTFIDINIADLRMINVLLPSSREEQDQIAAKITSVERKLKTEESTLNKYKQIKTGLMQDLLTGKVEVNIDETEK